MAHLADRARKALTVHADLVLLAQKGLAAALPAVAQVA
jgi:hypothetical protein